MAALRGGWADEGFGAVADAFERNFAEEDELGAAVAVFAGGRQVVDLWGGVADDRNGRPWERETTVPVFSCAKGLVSLCVQLLAQEGRLDLDAPVSRYWPEFAQYGKDAVTCRQVLAHRAGIPALDRVLTVGEIAAWTPVIRAIEEQQPLWEPGAAYEYHGHVFGFLLGEVVRRLTGLTPGAYFRRTVGEPLGLRAWLALPDGELGSLARLSEAGERPALPGPESLIMRTVTMNGALAFPGLDEPYGWNDPALLGMELPGAGGAASASGLAGVYAAAVTGVDGGGRLLTPETVADAVRETSSGPSWSGLDFGHRWGSGFLLDSPARRLLGARSFANDGAGGQFAFGDDEFGVGFAYLANRMIGHGDARAERLTKAVRKSVGAPAA
ncbi:serine hydrolase domain-containing protein [Streptomyces nanshensis]|uniref:Carboxylesterase n=1 Tax=Streptomyces nanshensis TaxID=518642 RepID=A0A1E7LAW3_9ACTN|nr:serine hydrolase domain-containing protein [Streptomyces nanshensis]OEV13347.1 carboxylesterase [Streptomyces nanshensis]